jgi:hypothetical protein
MILCTGHDKNRLLTHFYSFMFFAEPEMERIAKRFVRDRMRYSDDVYCAAGRVVKLIYDSMHATASSAESNAGVVIRLDEPRYDPCEIV